MKKQRVTKSSKKRAGAHPAAGKARKPRSGKPSGLDLMAAAAGPSRRNFALSEALELYRPRKKPVTLRLDADVLAWFKKDGRRYQTRINGALRKVMEREMRAAKG
jgi:uncharacterized protein (DUF4415 family)